MIVVRFRQTFRERMPEWMASGGMLMWALLALGATNVFTAQQLYHPLLIIMPQIAWGIIVLITGILRLAFLVINGAWRPSAHIRALGCGLGVILWSSLFYCALNLPWLFPGMALYTILLFTDLFSLWFAAGDAKLADLTARGTIGVK